MNKQLTTGRVSTMTDLLIKSRDSEEAVVGFFLLHILDGGEDETADILASIDYDDILNTDLRNIYKASARYIGKPVTSVEIASAGHCDIEQLKRLVATSTQHINIKAHVKMILDMSRRYKIVKLTERAKNKALSQEDISTIIGEIETKLVDIDTSDPDEADSAENVLFEVVNEIESAKKNGYDESKFISTHIQSLDDAIGGMEGGWLVLIGARPGMGKTQLALMTAQNMAMNEVPTLFFSLEMSKKELIRRLILEGTKVTFAEAKHGHITAEQLQSIHAKASKIHAMPMYIDDKGGITMAHIDNIVKRHVTKYGVRCVFIDYLQLISGDGSKSAYERTTQISQGLKNIAKRHGVTVVALSQLSRLNEARKDRRPGLSDLRDSGSLEQDADIVMLLYRDAYYTESISDNTLEVNIAKHRHGSVRTVKLYYNPARGTIKDFERSVF